MHPVQKHLMDTEFSGLAGTQLEGTISLSDELINLGLLEVLAKLKAAGAPKPIMADTEVVDPKSKEKDDVDPQVFLKNLNVEKLQYRTEEGKTLLEIKAKFG